MKIKIVLFIGLFILLSSFISAATFTDDFERTTIGNNYTLIGTLDNFNTTTENKSNGLYSLKVKTDGIAYINITKVLNLPPSINFDYVNITFSLALGSPIGADEFQNELLNLTPFTIGTGNGRLFIIGATNGVGYDGLYNHNNGTGWYSSNEGKNTRWQTWQIICQNNITTLTINKTTTQLGNRKCDIEAFTFRVYSGFVYYDDLSIMANTSITPLVYSVVLNSSSGYNPSIIDNKMTGYVNGSSLQYRDLNYQYIWYRNGANYSNGSLSGFNNNQLVNLVNLSANTALVNDSWVLSVRAFSQGVYSNYVNSSPLNFTNIGIDNCSSYTTPTLNISFKDLLNTPAYVNGTSLINYDSSFYYESFHNKSYAQYCIYPSWLNQSFSANFQYIDVAGTNYYNSKEGYLNSNLQSYTFYVNYGTSVTTFTIKDDNNKQQVIDNAQCTSYVLLNGIYTMLETKSTDITGQVSFNYAPNTNYQFICSATNYNTYTFVLNPITAATYDIFLTPTTTVDYSNTYDRVSINVWPQIFYPGANTFNFTIDSFYDELSYYSYTLTYPGGTTTNSGTNPSGEFLTSNFNIVGANFLDLVQLDITYTMPVLGTKTIRTFYPIGNTTGNITLMNPINNDKTYGLGLLERLLIVVFGAIVIAGLCVMIGMDLPGIVLALFWSGYWCYVGFVPLWAFLPSIFIAVIIISWRSQ